MQDLSLHILDVAENGINAGATLVAIEVEEQSEQDKLTITIEDNGSGMDPAFLERVLDPFVTTRTTRKVGMGLSLLEQAVQAADGTLTVESARGKGTRVKADMSRSHIDRKPMGNMADTITTLIEGNPEVDLLYVHRKDGREFRLDTREIRTELEEVPLNVPAVIGLIRDTVAQGLDELSIVD